MKKSTVSIDATSTPTHPTKLPNVDVEEVNECDYKKGGNIMGSSNLQDQRKNIIKTSYYTTAHNNVIINGVLWDHPPTLIINSMYPLKQCCRDFFRLPIFNWLPDAMLGLEWRPVCPNCGKKMSNNGHGNPPKLVFGQYQNYLLHAPNRYICSSCQDKYNACEHGDKKKISIVSNQPVPK